METIGRTCPVCSGADTTPQVCKGDLTLVRCRNCGMVFANPVSASYLDGTFYEDAGRSFYLSPEKLAGDYSPVRFAREIRIMRRFFRRGRILDVGCSSGAFLFQLISRFPDDFDVYGTDVSGPALDYAESKGIRVISEGFLTHDFKGLKFDGITFWAVLEHVSDPKAFVAKAWEVLNPGGWCFVLVPNFESLAVRLLGKKYRYILPQHVNYFDSCSVQKLCCPPFLAHYNSTSHFNPIVITKDFLGELEPTQSDRSKLLVKTNHWKQNPAFLPIRFIYSAVEKALGRLGLADNCVLVLRREA